MAARQDVRVTWSAADLGAAMIAHYTSTAKGWRSRGDGVEGPAHYRGGDNTCAFRIVETRGVAMDARRDRTFNAKQYAEEIVGCALPEMMARYGSSSAVVRAPTPPRAESFPPHAEVLALWNACVDVDRVPAAASWLTSRGLPLDRTVDAGAVRAVPTDAAVPRWARQAGRSWADAFAVVAGLYDAHGELRSLHARRTVEDDGLSKTSSPVGYTTRGLVMADGRGRPVLAGDAAVFRDVVRISQTTRRPAVVLTEGLPAFSAWATDASDADEDAPAVLGILSGSWTLALATRIPDGARVLIDVDSDNAGDGYAAAIAETLHGRAVELGRAKRAA